MLEHIKEADEVLYLGPEHIHGHITPLIENIKQRFKNTGLYQEDKIYTKSDLQDPRWFQNKPKSFENRTSGTTDGTRFKYRILTRLYSAIESDMHYGLIAREFGIKQNARIMVALPVYMQRSVTAPYTLLNTANPIMSHGLGKQATVLQIQFNNDYINNYQHFWLNLIFTAIDLKIDILLIDGSLVSSLAWFAGKHHIQDKVARLISCTNNPVDTTALEFLKSNGNCDHWCDHMRSWDGGATFFSCRYGTYHLMDTLAWTKSVDSKLVSHDYFSLASPFYNYWNGDLAEIDTEYYQCKCGRWHRPMRLIKSREALIRDTTTVNMANTIKELGIEYLRLECIGNLIRLIVSAEPTSAKMLELKKAFPRCILKIENFTS